MSDTHTGNTTHNKEEGKGKGENQWYLHDKKAVYYSNTSVH
jgi:hypothetical protein